MKLLDKLFEKKFEEFLERKLAESDPDTARPPLPKEVFNRVPRELPPNMDLSICNPESGEKRHIRLIAQVIGNPASVGWFDDWPYPYDECIKRLQEGRVDPEHYALLAAKFNEPFSVLTCYDRCTADDIRFAFAQTYGVG